MWQAAGYWTVVWIALLIVQGILPAVQIYLVKSAIDSFVAVTNNSISADNLTAALRDIGLLVALMLLGGATGSFNTWVRSLQSELAQDHLSLLIHNQAISLDFAFFESPAYYDLLHRANVETKHRAIALLESLGELIRSGLTLLSVVAVLLPLGILLPLGLFASSFPPLFAVYKTNRQENQWRLQNTQAQRYADYYNTLLTSREFAAELRLFNLGEHFQTAYQNLRLRLRRERMQLVKKRSLIQLGASFLSLAILGLALAWMVSQMSQGKLSLGDLALLLQSLWLAQSTLQLLLKNLSKSYQNLLFLQDLFEFLSLKQQSVSQSITHQKGETLKEIKQGIHFDRVCFCYPGSQRLALDDFTLTIPAGQIAAIVGENGAGKSTLTKLLCRLYDPKVGTIAIDGTNIRSFPVADLWRLFSVMFQRPIRYHDTAANNIALSALAKNPTRSQIEAIAQATGADAAIQDLPAGYDTLLGKQFGNAELSGGQWQRLALARAWLRSAPIVILDEPTSAMDAWAESNWLKRLRNLAKGKTVIVITHRFTTAQQADEIHIMAKGKIIESGTHQELLAKDGNYARSWRSQVEASIEPKIKGT